MKAAPSRSRPGPSQRGASAQDIRWLDNAIFAFGVIAVLVLLSVTVPQVEQAYTVFISPPAPDPKAAETIPGADFWIYWIGAQAYLHQRNPYHYYEALQAVRDSIPLAHPDANFTAGVISNFRPDQSINQYMGYVGFPVNLWLWTPLARMHFVTAALAFWMFSVFVYGTVAAVFTAKLVGGSKIRRAGAILIALTILGIDSNIRTSLRFGQIDALYLSPLAFAAYLFAFKFEHRWARWMCGAALGLSTGIKVFPGFIIPMLLVAAMIHSYRAVDAPFLRALLRDPLFEAFAAATGMIVLLVAITAWMVPFPVIAAWLAKIKLMAGLPTIAPFLNPDPGHYIRYWSEVLGFGSISWSYWLALLLALPLAGWISVRVFAEAAQRKDSPVRLLAFGVLIALIPFLNSQQADYYNLIMMIPIIAGLLIRKPPLPLPWIRRALPSLLLITGYLLINSRLRMALMTSDFAEWWFELDKTRVLYKRFYATGQAPEAFASPDNLLGGFPGNLLIWAGALLALIYALRAPDRTMRTAE